MGDPITRELLKSGEVITNWGKRDAVQRFLEQHPGFVPPGWDSRALAIPEEQLTRQQAAAELGALAVVPAAGGGGFFAAGFDVADGGLLVLDDGLFYEAPSVGDIVCCASCWTMWVVLVILLVVGVGVTCCGSGSAVQGVVVGGVDVAVVQEKNRTSGAAEVAFGEDDGGVNITVVGGTIGGTGDGKNVSGVEVVADAAPEGAVGGSSSMWMVWSSMLRRILPVAGIGGATAFPFSSSEVSIRVRLGGRDLFSTGAWTPTSSTEDRLRSSEQETALEFISPAQNQCTSAAPASVRGDPDPDPTAAGVATAPAQQVLAVIPKQQPSLAEAANNATETNNISDIARLRGIHASSASPPSGGSASKNTTAWSSEETTASQRLLKVVTMTASALLLLSFSSMLMFICIWEVVPCFVHYCIVNPTYTVIMLVNQVHGPIKVWHLRILMFCLAVLFLVGSIYVGRALEVGVGHWQEWREAVREAGLAAMSGGTIPAEDHAQMDAVTAGTKIRFQAVWPFVQFVAVNLTTTSAGEVGVLGNSTNGTSFV